LDYLGLTVNETLPENAPPELHDVLRDCCSLLNRERKEVWIYPHRSRRSKRANKLHEATHFICPTHVDFNVFACKENETERPGYKRQEQEAFQGASAFLMPVENFTDGILSYPMTLRTIERLHDLYDAPLGVAAIWYAYVNPRICAVVMVEPNTETPDEATTPSEYQNGPWLFPLDVSSQPRKPTALRYTTRSGQLIEIATPRDKYPLRVRYASHSSRLRRLKFIRSGTGIDEENLIFKAWREQRPLNGEIPAAVFGSSEKWGYHAECLPLGKNGKILTLLWLTDHQPFKLFT
jgi:hypothetical protein